jgi:O-acetyl-ADP-ribose deacetylase (regulator of RNase III)
MLEIIIEDITRIDVDAVVNAANPSLLGGAGWTARSIMLRGLTFSPNAASSMAAQRATPKSHPATACYSLLQLARTLCHSYRRPVWEGGTHGEDDLLASCYRRSLEIAAQHRVRSIAFPAISTGVYGFPADRAAAESSAALHARALAALRES